MRVKSLFVLSIMTAIAIACTKSDGTAANTSEEQKEETGGGGGESSPSGNGGVYSETFAGYGGKVDSGYLAQESFTSSATGVTWTLDFGKIDQTEDHAEFYGEHCFTLGGKSGKADNGQSVLSTSPLADGITKLEFDYVANKDKKLEVQVLVGGKTVWTSGTMDLVNNGQSDTKVLEHKSFTITGANSGAVVRFINISSARRISIGNITWTNATLTGGNGKVFDGGGEGGSEGGEQGGEQGGDDEVYTTLTSDVTVSGINFAEAYYYGDYFEFGTNDWQFYIGNDNEELGFELFTDLNATTPEGTYTVDLEYSGAKGTIWDGYDYDGYTMPAYYNYTTEDYAYPAGGTVTIGKSGNVYTVAISLSDELGHKISANYSGTMTVKEGEIIDEDEEDSVYASASATKATMTVKHVKAQKADRTGRTIRVFRCRKVRTAI